MVRRSVLVGLGVSASLGLAYGINASVAWLQYGRPRPASSAWADPLLDRFLPKCEIVERHSTLVHAPADVTLEATSDLDFEDSRVVRAIFKARELLLGGKPAQNKLPRGLLAQMKAIGWGVLAEVPGHEIVMGAVTQPWVANTRFHAGNPVEFVSFQDPGYVKIVWTLRADAISATTSVFRTETRALALGPESRAKFRKYWAFVSPGIKLIRLAMLRPLRREAERRALLSQSRPVDTTL